MSTLRSTVANEPWTPARHRETEARQRREDAMRTIQVYEPALCPTRDVRPRCDQALLTFTADLEHLKGRGPDIARHNLANDPSSFAANDAGFGRTCHVAGSDGLPLTLVDGVTVMAGSLPDRAQLLAYAQLADVVAVPAGVARLELIAEKSVRACGPTGCCGGVIV